MSRVDRIVAMEHLAVESTLTLHEFCDRFRRILNLPEFHFDFENETEWGLVEVDNVEYNVSRPYAQGTLQKWDDTIPVDCNVAISLVLYREHPHAHDRDWTIGHLVKPIAQQLADELETTVHHHRTWCGPDENVKRYGIWKPAAT